jgi:hypothetical protein
MFQFLLLYLHDILNSRISFNLKSETSQFPCSALQRCTGFKGLSSVYPFAEIQRSNSMFTTVFKEAELL